MEERLLKWFYQLCRLMDGLVGVLTIGFIDLSLGLWASKVLSRSRRKSNP